jgi:hypothetical protein
VLCPGFVKTNLVASQQWPSRLGQRPAESPNAIGQLVWQMLADGVENGIDPDGVALQVVDAVKSDRFWILTHPELRHAPVERMLRAEAQENPA